MAADSAGCPKSCTLMEKVTASPVVGNRGWVAVIAGVVVVGGSVASEVVGVVDEPQAATRRARLNSRMSEVIFLALAGFCTHGPL